MKIVLTVLLAAFYALNTLAQQNEQKTKSVGEYYNAIKSAPDPQKKEKLMIEMEKAGLENDGMQGIDLVDYSRQLVAQAFAEERAVKKTIYWTARVKEAAAKINLQLGLVSELTKNNQLAEAEKLLLPIYDQLKKDSGTATSSTGMTRMPVAADCDQLYATILYRKGDYKKALQYLAEPPVGKSGPGRRGDNSELYALTLAKAGVTDKAVEVMQRLIIAPGYHSDEFKVTARNLFIKKYGNDIPYRQLMDSAAMIEHQKIVAKVEKMKVNEPAPDFELTDLVGKKVSLKSLRGKTVILDFWATWCQPCVASFPGMQKAVDYYRQDTTVVFMFIHTMEKNDHAAEEASQFMNYKKYRFDVYMDLRDKVTKQSPVVASYKVRGIPAKFVIDKEGIIRFKNTGYISEEEAVPEISTMVDAIKAN